VKRGKVHSNLNNIYLENNQKIQYIKHSKFRQDSETSNSIIIFCKHHALNWHYQCNTSVTNVFCVLLLLPLVKCYLCQGERLPHSKNRHIDPYDYWITIIVGNIVVNMTSISVVSLTVLATLQFVLNANWVSNHRRKERICIHVAMPNNKICIPSVRLFSKVKIQQSFMEHSTFINE
jgi:hypothetical protein